MLPRFTSSSFKNHLRPNKQTSLRGSRVPPPPRPASPAHTPPPIDTSPFLPGFYLRRKLPLVWNQRQQIKCLQRGRLINTGCCCSAPPPGAAQTQLFRKKKKKNTAKKKKKTSGVLEIRRLSAMCRCGLFDFLQRMQNRKRPETRGRPLLDLKRPQSRRKKCLRSDQCSKTKEKESRKEKKKSEHFQSLDFFVPQRLDNLELKEAVLFYSFPLARSQGVFFYFHLFFFLQLCSFYLSNLSADKVCRV